LVPDSNAFSPLAQRDYNAIASTHPTGILANAFSMAKTELGRVENQMTGMAGEFLNAGKLFKLRLQVSITLGNAKVIDLFVFNPRTDQTFVVQVKTVRLKNCFLIRREELKPNHIYVFVILNGPEQQEEFFVVPGHMILDSIDHFFGSSYRRAVPSSMPAINYGPLKEFRDKWEVFETLAPESTSNI